MGPPLLKDLRAQHDLFPRPVNAVDLLAYQTQEAEFVCGALRLGDLDFGALDGGGLDVSGGAFRGVLASVFQSFEAELGGGAQELGFCGFQLRAGVNATVVDIGQFF